MSYALIQLPGLKPKQKFMSLMASFREKYRSFDPLLRRYASQHHRQKYSGLTLVSYWAGPFLIATCHLGAFGALLTGLSIGAWLWIALLYWVRMLAITGIYHRLLTHKAYHTPAPVKWIGSLVASSAGQMGPSWWKGHHDEHHLFSDQSRDPHNSNNGIWWSHYQWLLSRNFLPTKLPLDVEQDVVLKTIDRLHFVPTLALALASYSLGGNEYLAAFFVSTVLLFHGVATTNSLCHKFGETPFHSEDHSRNNGFVAFLTLGEGWHNCHHAFPWSARQGITVENDRVKYLPDPTFAFIRLLQSAGIASKLRLPAEKAMLTSATNQQSNQPALEVIEYTQ